MIATAWTEALRLPRDPPVLRRFGLVVGGAVLLVALWLLWRGGWGASTGTITLFALGSLLVALGLVRPRLLGGVYPVWMAFALVLGTIMTTILLTAVFYLVVTPIGLALRLGGKDPMHRRPDPEVESYWIRRSEESNASARLEKYY